MARGFLTSIFLYFMSITMVHATGIVCSDYNNSRSNCENAQNCTVITDQNNPNFFFCVPNCVALSNDTCANVAGCQFNDDTGTCDKSVANKYPEWENGLFKYYDCPYGYKSQVGNDSIDFCYKPCANGSDADTINCGVYKYTAWSNRVSCLVENTDTLIPSNDFHVEGDKCYLNTRPCNNFTSNLAEGTVTGNATWNNNNYNTSNCEYSKSESDNTLNCEKTVIYIGPSNVSLATNTITYSPASYYCTACTDATYYPTAGTTTEYPTCGNPESGHYKACSCVKIEKGYYNKNDTIWQNSMPITNVIIEPCPMGQTTASAGSDTCIYDSDTKICDSNGCTSLSNPSTWVPNN